MLVAEALRLAAVEVLCPTAANEGTIPFPTLAGRNFYDSRAAAIGDIDAKLAYQPVAALYTREASRTSRGPATDVDDAEGKTMLEVVAELATVVTEGGDQFVDAIAAGDAEAQLTLAAFCAQIQWLLLHSERGYLFRKLCLSVDRIEAETHAVPNLGLRWCRVFLRFHMTCPVDHFSDAAGFPELVRSFAAALPAGSYAKARLEALEAKFLGQARTPLQAITLGDPGSNEPGGAGPYASFKIPQA